MRAETDLKSQILNSGASPEPRVPSPAPAAAPVLNLLPYQRRWVEDDSTLKIAVKARQIGYSFAATLRAVFKCLERKTTWIFLSKGERQSRLLMEKVQDHIRSCGIVAQRRGIDFFEGTSLKQLEVRFPNGSVIYGLPANPDTARGYSGHVTLDEFAFHADAAKIYAALFPTITRGYGLEVISTPNGTQGKFYELARAAGLTEQVSGVRCQVPGDPRLRGDDSHSRGSGNPPDTRHPAPGTWSPHYCDIYDAVRDGLQIDINLLRSGCEDASAWQQEFCCQFVSTAENFFPPDLLSASLSAEAGLGIPENRNWKLETGNSKLEIGHSKLEIGPSVAAGEDASFQFPISNFQFPTSDSRFPTSEFFLGIDIGRRHDRTVFWVDEVQVPGAGDQVLGDPRLRGDDSHSRASGNPSDTRHLTPDTSAVGDRRYSVARLVRTMENTPFAEQLQAARELLLLRADVGTMHESPFLIRRACIDATGIGAPLAEALEREFGPRVEPVVFTAAVKEDLAFRTKRRMEARLTLLPDTREVRRAFSAVKKFVTPSGNLRFDAARTDAGHADEFWAKALADLAADPQAREVAARAEDAFLVDAMPIVSAVAFREVDSNWSEFM